MNISSEYFYVVGIKYSLGIVFMFVLKLSDVVVGMVNYYWSIVVMLCNIVVVMILWVIMKMMVIVKDSGKIVVKVIK